MPTPTSSVHEDHTAERNGASSTPLPTSAAVVLQSDTTRNLLALSQDITALLSLSLESSASYVYNFYRQTLGFVGLGEVAALRPATSYAAGGEGARGLAVVVVGGGERCSLSLRLAKSGYTVFPLVPLPSSSSPPFSASLSNLLLAWSRMQKRIRTQYPNHPGALVPVITDPDNTPPSPSSNLKSRGRHAHAGETVRAYCAENHLVLVAVICAARSPGPSVQPHVPKAAATHNHTTRRVKFTDDTNGASDGDMDANGEHQEDEGVERSPTPPRETSSLQRGALCKVDEQLMMSLYRANIIEPLGIIRELQDLLSHSQNIGRGRSRVIFVNGTGGRREESDDLDGRRDAVRALELFSTARAEMARLLRGELAEVGIDVCEVLVGPMTFGARLPSSIRRVSQDSSDGGLDVSPSGANANDTDEQDVNQILARRVALLSRIWAVDDALLFSAVRRAIEERYPRYRHHAGISPLIARIADITPGSGVVKVIGRWLVGKLLTPRR